MVFVTKWNGTKEEYQREKVIRTCLRLDAPREVAEEAADRVEEKLYDGIPTKEILETIYGVLKEHKASIAFRKDLRESIAEMRPTDFEEYVRLVLRAHGYEVTPNEVVQGRCAAHEIDGVARKDGETIYLEIKHHYDPHNYTPFGVSLEAKATWDDLVRGFEEGENETRFDRALIVCNTKLTEHARGYARCVGIDHVGWNEPVGHGFERMVEEKRVYPLTLLKGLEREEGEKLAEAGVILLSQLADCDPRQLSGESSVPETRLRDLVLMAKRALSGDDH